MTRQKLEQQVERHTMQLLIEKGYASPIDLLIKMDRLKPKQVDDWRRKRTPFLERAMAVNLNKLNFILSTLKRVAKAHNLKPKQTNYQSWGKGAKQTLQFSKSGQVQVEKLYSTHYVRL
ncbi:hypothetical protein [Piscibacillus salipiscarius]|uniref:Uncharacterized protein n=1 Tax=Piscibacillus salipiscarius TaxID=299480 RepID=A0ABW5QB40_9BACI|nr:hypothetical protein [Piscibacillus salipiscarius]